VITNAQLITDGSSYASCDDRANAPMHSFSFSRVSLPNTYNQADGPDRASHVSLLTYVALLPYAAYGV
jgi:hypothetical protein